MGGCLKTMDLNVYFDPPNHQLYGNRKRKFSGNDLYVDELYTAIGYNRHGKTELFRSLMRHLERPDARFDRRTYRALRRRGRRLVRRHFPYEMSVKMLLKPLGLGAGAQRIAVPLAETLARRLVP